MVNDASEAVRDTGSGLVDKIKSNPLPAALIGLGLGWLFMKGQNSGSNSSTMQYRSPDTYRGSSYVPYRPAYTPPASRPNPYIESRYSRQTGGNEGLLGTIRQNPLPVALAGAGLGWLFMKNQGGGSTSQTYSRDWNESYRYGSGAQNWPGQFDRNPMEQVGEKIGDVTGKVGEKLGDATNKVGEKLGDAGNKVGEIAGQAGELVSHAGEKVGEFAGEVGNTAGEVVQTVQYKARQAENELERLYHENPMLAAGVALSAGIALGLLLPSTEPEKKLMGETRDQLVEKVQEVAGEALDKVKEATQDIQASNLTTDQNQSQGYTQYPYQA